MLQSGQGAKAPLKKLIIQIPCYNEAKTLPLVIASLPKHIEGVSIELLVIDDGSTDGTAQVALESGVHHVVRHVGNKRLPTAFQTGIDTALRLGADIIVNIDGDNAHPGELVPALIQPILEGQAEMVVGDRQTDLIPHFSPTKKLLQKVGSWVVRQASGTDVPDTVSGFRAISREAALRLFVTSEFSYTVENLIQAGKIGLTVGHIPVFEQTKTRPSRLHRGTWQFVQRQALTIVRTYAQYEPLRVFFFLALPFVLIGLGLLGRIVVLALLLGGLERGAHTQSLIFGGVALLIGLFTILFGILADLVRANRRLAEEILYRVRKLESEANRQASENNNPIVRV